MLCRWWRALLIAGCRLAVLLASLVACPKQASAVAVRLHCGTRQQAKQLQSSNRLCMFFHLVLHGDLDLTCELSLRVSPRCSTGPKMLICAVSAAEQRQKGARVQKNFVSSLQKCGAVHTFFTVLRSPLPVL